MNRFLSTVCVLACAVLPARADEPVTLESAFSSMNTAVRESWATRELRQSWIEVHKCWVREPHEEADKLGLPRRFCIDRLGIELPKWANLPFTWDSAMLVEGDPITDKLHINGGAQYPTKWKIGGNLFTKRKKLKCGKLTSAHATVNVEITKKGELLPTEPIIRAFLMGWHSYRCEERRVPTVDIIFTKEARPE